MAVEWNSLKSEEKLKYFKIAKEENETTFKEIEDELKELSLEEKIEIKKLIKQVLCNGRLRSKAYRMKHAKKIVHKIIC